MLVILAFFDTLLLPILVLAFVFFGLASAITSATIEATVFSMLLAGGDQTSNTGLMCYVVVGGLETFKVVSVYLTAVSKNSSSTLPSIPSLKIARHVLSTISLIATFSYVCNSLYASRTTAAFVDAVQQEISELNTQILAIESLNYDAASDSRLDSYKEELRIAVSLAESHQNEWGATSYMEAVSMTSDKLNQAALRFQEEFDLEKSDRIASLQDEIAELEAEVDMKNLNTLRANNNSFLDRTLSLIWQMAAQQDYPQQAYWFTAVGISLILGGGIEFVISGALTFLAQPRESLRAAFHVSSETAKASSWLSRMALQLVCALAFMLLFALVLKYSTGSVSLEWQLSSVTLATGIPFVNLFFDRTSSNQKQLSGIKRFFMAAEESGKEIGITSATLIGLYFLIGVLTRSVNPGDMSIPQVAALLAGAVGSRVFASAKV